jgi:hypothetical protein
MCRAILRRPDFTDEEAEALLDQMYGAADVCVEAFIEQHARPATIANPENEPLPELGNETLASDIHAV